MNDEIFDAVALTAAAALCSGIADLAHGTKLLFAADADADADADTWLLEE